MTAHHHHHDHHGRAEVRASARHRTRLALALVIGVCALVIEAVASALTGSLALLSDAGHVLTDTAGLALALGAIGLADRSPPTKGRTFGLYRLEILAALVNAGLLLVVAGYVVVEALQRLAEPRELDPVPIIVVAAVGLVANLVAALLLRPGAKESLNVEGAYLEVVADLLGSVGVVASALVLWATGWTMIDPLVGLTLAVWILPRGIRLARRSLRILVQAAPAGLDVDALASDLTAIPGVVDVHDVHVWTLTSEMDVATAHLMVSEGSDHHAVLDEARDLLAARYGIKHGTFQIEPTSHTGCDELDW